MSDIPRGIANNNPGNIRISAETWLNKKPVEDNTDGVFEQFIDPVSGIRAMFKNMQGLQRGGLNTIAMLIGGRGKPGVPDYRAGWAPPTENNTAAYINFVSTEAGISPAQVVDFHEWAVAFPVGRAIVKQENGQQPFSEAIFRAAARMAGVNGVPQ